MPARLSVFDASGKSYAPDDAWRHADEAFVRSERRFEYGYFHANAACTLTVPAGQYIVEASHGPEFAIARREVRVEPDGTTAQDLVLDRLADMPARGWWSGDLHVHMNYGGTYRNTPAHLKFQAQAEDLHVVENLIVNKEQRIPDIGYFQTTPDSVSDGQFALMHAEEFHTSFWGHTALLGLQQPLPSAELRGLCEHRRIEPGADQHRRVRSGARTGWLDCLRAPLRREAGSSRPEARGRACPSTSRWGNSITSR